MKYGDCGVNDVGIEVGGSGFEGGELVSWWKLKWD